MLDIYKQVELEHDGGLRLYKDWLKSGPIIICSFSSVWAFPQLNVWIDRAHENPCVTALPGSNCLLCLCEENVT